MGELRGPDECRMIDPTRRTGDLDCTFGPTRPLGELDGSVHPTRPFGELDGFVRSNPPVRRVGLIQLAEWASWLVHPVQLDPSASWKLGVSLSGIRCPRP
ncbi:hypothetical protein DY000_02020973 [Brassica cretica]|uniref:Uncharacterized protein n=1 Tax=Brassica cretica TaxID=69181 RepID=A0ABQ7ECR0_BRACR|nr:hypothetical protein DY000_02020973 [Brassica cretica]